MARDLAAADFKRDETAGSECSESGGDETADRFRGHRLRRKAPARARGRGLRRPVRRDRLWDVRRIRNDDVEVFACNRRKQIALQEADLCGDMVARCILAGEAQGRCRDVGGGDLRIQAACAPGQRQLRRNRCRCRGCEVRKLQERPSGLCFPILEPRCGSRMRRPIFERLKRGLFRPGARSRGAE